MTDNNAHVWGVTILHGDAARIDLPDASVDLIVTSPPYSPTAPRYKCCRHCRDWPEGCPESGHVVPCVVGCELGAQPIRPLVWTTSGLRMVAE